MEEGKIRYWSQPTFTDEMLENAPHVEPNQIDRQILKRLDERAEAVELLERVKRAQEKHTKKP